MHYLVTGGSGFIGSNLVNYLIEKGHTVSITATSGENINPNVHKTFHLGMSGIDVKSLEKYDGIFHLAANNDTLCQDKEFLNWVNADSPLELFHKLNDKGLCKNFVYASTTAVYGHSPAPYVEDKTIVMPANRYGQSKVRLEKLMASFADYAYAKAVGLRFCNVYGPGEGHKGRRMSMIGQMLRNKMRGEKVKLFEPGTQRRDWVYVDDVVIACMLAMDEATNRRGGYHDIFNVGSGNHISFNELAMAMFGNGHVEYIKCPFKDAYQEFTCCDLTKIHDTLGYMPAYGPLVGIDEYGKKEKALLSD